MVQVSSEAIREISYDPSTRMLDVTFQNGRTYTHAGVPAEVYERFVGAPSKGGFYNLVLKGQYSL